VGISAEPLVAWRINHQEDTEASDLLCETYYRLVVTAAEKDDLFTIQSNLAALRQINPGYQDLAQWSQRFPYMAWVSSSIKVIRLWSVDTATSHRLPGSTDIVHDMAFSPDGRLLATQCIGGISTENTKIWEVSNGRLLRQLPGGYSLTFSPDGKLFAVGGSYGKVIVWDVSSAWQPHTLTDGGPSVFCVAFSPDRGLLATGRDDGTVQVWETSSGQQLYTLVYGEAVSSVAFSPDGRLLAAGGGDRNAKIWDLEGTPQLCTLVHGSIAIGAFSSDGRLLATICNDRTAKVWEVSSAQYLHTLTHSGGSVYSVAFHPNGRLLATGGDGGTKVWEVSSGRQLHTLTHGDRSVAKVAFSPDGLLLVTGGVDGVARLWEPEG